mgnify:CR=1 FL=1
MPVSQALLDAAPLELPKALVQMEHQRLVEQAAKEMKIDRAELRRRNFVPVNGFPYATPVALTMRDDGLNGDGAAGDGVFGAAIPVQAAGTIVSYSVTATSNPTRAIQMPAPCSIE